MTNTTLSFRLGALLLALGAVGCESFLTGPKLTENPNAPSAATRDQLFVAVQASQITQFEGALARVACMWIQQCAGTDRQYLTLGVYQFNEDDFSGQFSRLYIGGGLIDMRRIQASALASGDSVYAGIAMVYEAMAMGMGAALWGDIPYSEAVAGIAAPALDPQDQIFAALQAKLDTAILWIPKTGGANIGPASLDLVYGGDRTRWVEAAHTLKARLHLYRAERDSAVSYAGALAEAQLGISTSANNFRTFHSGSTTENNIWYQFQVIQRDSYLRAGKFLVDLLNARADPRLPDYFAQNTGGTYVGAAPGEALSSGHSNISATRLAPSYRQPLITWAENQLILAEAAAKTGDDGTALTALNAVRTDAGLTGLVGITGQALRDSIAFEKYVVTFQTIEAWNDYKRTCMPAITPAAPATEVPGRLFYGSAERNANPNIPAPSAQPLRNWNDPNPC